MPDRPPVDLEDLARCLWTIGDLTRLQLLERLPKSLDCADAQNVSRLAEELGLTQSTVSSHLARLRTLGIVRPSRRCRDVHYTIDRERVEQIVEDLRRALKLCVESESAPQRAAR
jgi:DNA-binding transcriptional ArsR family regulator